ncbi:hypothetical protein C8R44DRAFT_787566 [Mycena epipterygia]|nr:hypothetical protein C8R44DRAFT_787566 [Mycena epipterygia]
MSAQSPPGQDALAPFSGALDLDGTNPNPDFILKSCDAVDFHVHKQILAFVSVFFSDMFTFPAGEGGPTELKRDGKPVLILPESEDVLYRLLSIAYPARSRQHYSLTPAELDSVRDVHEAAHKYQFIQAQTVIKEMLLDPALLDGQPHRLFAIAVLRQIPEVAEQAALCTLKSSLCPADLAFPEMRLITWDVVQKLINFHHKCGMEAQKIVEATGGSLDPWNQHEIRLFASRDPQLARQFIWWEEQYHSQSACEPAHIIISSGYPGNEFDTDIAPQWFQNHTKRVAAQVRLVPTGSTLTAEALNISASDRAVIDACEICSGAVGQDLAKFASLVAEYIDRSNQKLARGAFIF